MEGETEAAQQGQGCGDKARVGTVGRQINPNKHQGDIREGRPRIAKDATTGVRECIGQRLNPVGNCELRSDRPVQRTTSESFQI